ncbi:Fc.00g033360.m01.CDS01 [Cosmosporella sp. VM-42]
MCLRRRAIFAAVVAQAFLAERSSAQSLGKTIVGCLEVQCPTADGSVAAECKLADKTFTTIGLARIPTKVDALEGLSWVEGAVVSDLDGRNRTFDKSFYLGTPPNLSLNGSESCALFFTHFSERVNKFNNGKEDVSISQGTCDEAMSEKCVSAIVSRAEGVDLDGLSSEDACEKLQKEFEDNLDSECAPFADGSKWVGLKSTRAVALSGSGGVEPISSKDNSSSECWPITPKSYDLSYVDSIVTEGDYYIDTLSKELFGITPILTIFFPGDSDAIISKPEAQMTCMKVVDTSVGTNATKSPGGEDKGNGARSLGLGGRLVTAVSFATSLYVLA